MAAPVGPRWPDREEKEKGGGVNTKQIPGTNMHVAWSVKPPVNVEGNSCALQVLSGCFPAAGRAFAAPVSSLSTCSTFCCPSVSY